MMTAAQVVQMSVTVNNSPFQDYIHPDDHIISQRAKKVMSNSRGYKWILLLSCLTGKRSFFFRGHSNYRGTVISPASPNVFGLVRMTLGLVCASYSFPEVQAVKLSFFSPYS